MSAQSRGRINNHGGLEFLDDIPRELKRVLKPDSHLYVFCNHESYPDMKRRFSEAFDMSQLLVWEKPTYGVGDSETYSPVHEFIMHYRYGSPELRYGNDSKRPKNVIEFKRTRHNNEIVAHATQKPIELIDFLIEKSSDPGDLIADPYGGSFATGRAAQHTFRRAVCAEIDPEIAADGQDLAEHQLRNDPVYGVDWTDVSGLEVAQTELPTAEPTDAVDAEVKADD
jgi:site-specific DNA-methyltransferase (adenine-specific)